MSNFVPESEPRDAGTDQRSSGIIRLHTIKQIIDRVSNLCLLKCIIYQKKMSLHFFFVLFL